MKRNYKVNSKPSFGYVDWEDVKIIGQSFEELDVITDIIILGKNGKTRRLTFEDIEDE